MLKTIMDIFNYTNNELMEGKLNKLSDIINYLEECQNIIAEDKGKIPADPFTLTLTSNTFELPPDYLKYSEILVNGSPVLPRRVWGNTVYLPGEISAGYLELFYFRKPTILDFNTPDQEPDIDPRFYYAMGQYAAHMFYLRDEDTEVLNNFRRTFIDSINSYSQHTPAKTAGSYTNIW